MPRRPGERIESPATLVRLCLSAASPGVALPVYKRRTCRKCKPAQSRHSPYPRCPHTHVHVMSLFACAHWHQRARCAPQLSRPSPLTPPQAHTTVHISAYPHFYMLMFVYTRPGPQVLGFCLPRRHLDTAAPTPRASHGCGWTKSGQVWDGHSMLHQFEFCHRVVLCLLKVTLVRHRSYVACLMWRWDGGIKGRNLPVHQRSTQGTHVYSLAPRLLPMARDVNSYLLLGCACRHCCSRAKL